MAQRVDKQIGVFAAIESERHFVQIGLQVLRADLVPRSHDAALEQRECRLDGVGVNVALDIYTAAMIDSLVLLSLDSSFDHGFGITDEIVSDHNFHVSADVFLDELRQRTGLRILSVEEPQGSAALSDSDYDFLCVSTATVNAARMSANVGLVHLDGSAKQRSLSFLHSSPDAMTQVPCRLVAPADNPLDLVGAHTLAGFAEQVGRDKPFRQRKVRILKHGTRDHGKLMLTSVAFVAVVILKPRVTLMFAAWAGDAFGPAQALKNFAASFIRTKHFVQFDNRHRSTCGAR